MLRIQSFLPLSPRRRFTAMFSFLKYSNSFSSPFLNFSPRNSLKVELFGVKNHKGNKLCSWTRLAAAGWPGAAIDIYFTRPPGSTPATTAAWRGRAAARSSTTTSARRSASCARSGTGPRTTPACTGSSRSGLNIFVKHLYLLNNKMFLTICKYF